MKPSIVLATAAAAVSGIVAFAFAARPNPVPGTTFIFEATAGSAKLVHLEGPEIPGKVPFKNAANLLKVTECVKGNDPSCVGKVETDAGGKVYIYYDGLTSWRIATNPNAMNTTTLTGLVDGVGGFQMSGKHTLSDTTFFLTGKVIFAKGTLNPTKITGKIYAFSPLTEHYGSGNFLAKPIPI